MLLLTISICAAEPIRISITFHDSATVNDTVIRLGDIAAFGSKATLEKIESLKDAVVGEAAPAGYCRKVSCGDVMMYILKKQDAGYSFVANKTKAVMVATTFTEKKVGDFENIIMKYLSDSIMWQQGDYTVSVRNLEEKWKCLDKPIKVEIAGLASKYPKGNVNLKLVARQYSKIFTVPVVCCITVVTPVIVAKTAILKGTVLSCANCSIERKDITHFASSPYTDLSQLNDMVANRTIPAESILNNKLTSRMPIIGKDEQVYVVVDKGQVRVSVIMRAREQGALGDRIWVENELTHKLIKTKIIGKGKVELLEGVKSI